MMDGTTTDKTVDNGANCVVSGMVFVSLVFGPSLQIRKFRSVDPPSNKSESFRENVFVEFRMRRPVGTVSESTHGTRHHILGFWGHVTFYFLFLLRKKGRW